METKGFKRRIGVDADDFIFQEALNKLKGGFIADVISFKINYPKTKCRITSRGRKSFEHFFNTLKAYKDLGLVIIFGLSIIFFYNLIIKSNNLFFSKFFSSQNKFLVTADEIIHIKKILKTIMELY